MLLLMAFILAQLYGIYPSLRNIKIAIDNHAWHFFKSLYGHEIHLLHFISFSRLRYFALELNILNLKTRAAEEKKIT